MNAGVPFVLFFLILANALYVAAEFAAVGARVSRVEQFAARGHRLARALLPILRDSRRLDAYIAACQIGITVSSLVLGAVGQATLGLALGGWLHRTAGMEMPGALGLSATLVLVVLTSAQVVLGELIPKTIALQFPVRTALYTFLPMKWSLVAFTPLIAFLNGSGNVVLRLFGTNHARGHHHVHSPEEIEMLVSESAASGTIPAGKVERLRAGLRLSRRIARELMVPRSRIAGLDLREPLERLFDRIERSPFTRLIVYHGNLDDVRGFVHVKDVASRLARDGSLEDLPGLVRPLLTLSAELSAERVLGQLRLHHARLALLVNDAAEVEGLVTLQDLVNELLGEISDEFKYDVGKPRGDGADG